VKDLSGRMFTDYRLAFGDSGAPAVDAASTASIIGALLKCLFAERFGMVPEQAELDEYAAEAYRDALGEPSENGEPPAEPAVLSELLASIADATRTAWRRVLLEEHLSAMLQILAGLLRDRLETGRRPRQSLTRRSKRAC
jgi:hypothetical protein